MCTKRKPGVFVSEPTRRKSEGRRAVRGASLPASNEHRLSSVVRWEVILVTGMSSRAFSGSFVVALHPHIPRTRQPFSNTSAQRPIREDVHYSLSN